ncbi:MAG: DUF4331 family protein [Candidatus Eremiobacteraeota bacterium]|nr:DUF4331 family protein [Candidatus Eremiobacteraeota bacterium]
MRILRAFATVATTALVVATIALYGVHAARGSDHQDSPTVVARPGADITDVFAYPAPDNPANNVVLAMDVYPLIPAGQSSSPQYSFDPAVLYQFKIATGVATKNYTENLVIQFVASGAGSTQTLTMYGPAAPNETGTTNTLVKSAGTFPFNSPATLSGNIQVFAGPRRDPFFFDLAQFFKIIPDRNYTNHQNGATPPPATATSFNGFPANANGCNTTPSSNLLANFDVLQIAVELPKSMLEPNGASTGQVIGVWATTGTATGS